MIEVLLVVIVAILLFGAAGVLSAFAGFVAWVIAAAVMVFVCVQLGISPETLLISIGVVLGLLVIAMPFLNAYNRWADRKAVERIEEEKRK